MTDPDDRRDDGAREGAPADAPATTGETADAPATAGDAAAEDAPAEPAAGDDAGQGPSRSASAGGSLTRRQFAAGAGAALLLPAASRLTPWRDARHGGAGRDGDGVRGARHATRPGAPPPERGSPQEAEEEPPGTAALVDHVRARWGDRLSEDDLEQIRSSVAGQLRAGSSIAEVPLANGDGPATMFRAYRGGGA